MNKVEEYETILGALRKFGVSAQTIKTMEELAELIQALAKDLVFPNGDRQRQVCEEIADVEIMLFQMRQLYSNSLIDDFRHAKLKRLKTHVDPV